MAGFGADSRRYLCSHLVTLVFGGQRHVVNLEEICRTGAYLESDAPVPAGVRAEMRTEGVQFHGTVTEVEEHDLGWRIKLGVFASDALVRGKFPAAASAGSVGSGRLVFWVIVGSG